MLDTDTKRRIDTARDILVGKVPDPKSQVEQITIALIYKFMDDIDAQSEELGGQRTFFAGEFARYGWARLMRPGLGGHEVLNLYAEAIARMPENPGIPPLFRDIFNNAYLPYRDPETLRAFLKVIDEFTYDHSERLGDAFEYLLSVLGSQGNAGQFRTPRHIIDFIVSIIDPKKDEVILDPACGTAGFLISSYKHILAANRGADGSSTLTPDDSKRLADNFQGYDISPDMVRLSLVNMYLHGFVDPHIVEYDTLTSEDRWNDFADVILANPPFMSPKGGIRPHNRFSVQSKRSEVLFVDYMAEHLNPAGRAGIIVPEGIIFQSQKAHTQLRKMLVEDHLVAVVSLPGGVFKPYSGVKTSILILDRALARKSDSIAFFKVENDGFDLGDQRRPISENDLPQVEAELAEYLHRLRSGEPLDDFQPEKGLVVDKDRVAADGEYNLSGERYRDIGKPSQSFPMVSIGEICQINPGSEDPRAAYPGSYFNYIDISCVENETGKFLGANRVRTDDAPSRARRSVQPDDVLVSTVRPNLRSFTLLTALPERAIVSTGFAVLRANSNRLLPQFLINMIRDDAAVQQMANMMGRGSYPSINQTDVASIKIPFPPLEVQKEIVAEIEGCQKVIDGARAVVENYRPQITIDPAWPMVKISQTGLFRVESGGTPKSDVKQYWDGGVPWITLADLPSEDFVTEITTTERTISDDGLQKSAAKILPKNSVVVSSRATIGRIGINRIPLATNQGFKNVVIKDVSLASPGYVAFALTRLVPTMQAQASGATYKEITKSRFSELQIPLPPLETQQTIVAEIEAEQALVNANRELITRFEQKIRDVIGRVWGQ